MARTRRIAVATTGGDCPGLNSVLAALTSYAQHNKHWELVGLTGGVHGILENPIDLPFFMPLAQWMGTPGTLLRANSRGLRLQDSDYEAYKEAFRHHEIEALISVGGDGSLVLLDELSKKIDIPYVAIPKTIDNDVPLTDWCIGHASAVDGVRQYLENVHSTAYSHQRLFVVEVMGRDAGHLALRGGLAGCAHAILLPERKSELSGLANTVENAFHTHGYAVVLAAEGARSPGCNEQKRVRYRENEVRYGGIAEAVGQALGMTRETRFASIGHMIRGVQPIAFDRMLAQSFAVKASECVLQGKFNHIVAVQNDEVVALPVPEVRASKPPSLDSRLLYTAEQLGIYTGS